MSTVTAYCLGTISSTNAIASAIIGIAPNIPEFRLPHFGLTSEFHHCTLRIRAVRIAVWQNTPRIRYHQFIQN
ncbi:hypothetical protein ACU4HD_21475 [Cupriavidus basilensis]